MLWGGVDAATLLIVHSQELLDASQEAILPSTPSRLAAPAPPVPDSAKPKPVSRRRRSGKGGRGGGASR